ncbi:MAG: fibrobacter succinogenes major paralogous domain-containing protein [Alistipes sp.]|nr:fibrobacter succinogenes major paralogous domain-containing protein [Alistipes sp.]
MVKETAGHNHYPLFIHYSYTLFIDCMFLFVIHSSDRFSQAPAAGYRSNASGALGYVGERGHCWSSSSYAAGNINAGYLYFNAGNVNPLNNANRANGFSVRCVQHLQEAVFYLFIRKGVPAGRFRG